MARPKKPKEVKSDWGVSKEIQDSLLGHLTEEYTIAKRNNDSIVEDFNAYYDMLHCVREDKPNEWESDIFLPEFASRLLALIGNFVDPYFSSTDYVETALESEDPVDIAEAKASKKLLNKLLNDKEAYYYYKTVRNIMFVFTCGHGIIKGAYEQKIEKQFSHYVQKSEYVIDEATGSYLAEDGTVYADPTIQKPAYQAIQEPVYVDKVLKDRPIFDVYPPQNVKMSPEYAYSLADKEYVIFDTEKTLDDLRSEAAEMGYFNLELLAQENPEGRRGDSTYNKGENREEQPKPPMKTFVIMERWGKYPVIEKDGKYVPGIDKDGNWIEGATNDECIIHFAKNRDDSEPKHIIGFRKSRHSKRPMVRFLCYVDMLKDGGFGDGELTRETQKAINDNYNLMNYRTKLAITPAFKGKRFSVDEDIHIAPDKVTLLDNIEDLKEIDIKDNIAGGLQHHGVLSASMDRVMAIGPNQMGMSADRAETATVGAITNQRANVRIGMKSKNLEFIGFTEFYDMLLTLCNDFMLPQTLEELIGKELAMAYNPKRKDRFRPVSQALESEESKQFKIKSFQGMLGMVASIQNPKTPMVINYIIGQILETMGGSFKTFKKFMFEEDPTTMLLYQLATGAKGGTGSPPSGPNPTAPPNNQNGIQMSPTEQMTRGAANG